MNDVLGNQKEGSKNLLNGFKIRHIQVSPGLVLAPMSGVTNLAFRELIREINPAAVGLMVSEFISVEGLTRNNVQSIKMMQFREEERPFSIQIFGSEPSRMVAAAQMVEAAGADILDINCGCPVPKVVRRGGGCELMRQSENLAKILTEIRKVISIPLTLKIRAGWDSDNKNAVEIARMAEDCGVEMIAVHGRTRQEAYRGLADWDIILAVAYAVNIPVVGSGDIVSLDSIRKIEELKDNGAKIGLDGSVGGFMIGRGALDNPWVFQEITKALRGEPLEQIGIEEIVNLHKLYIQISLNYLPERAIMGRLKQLCSRVTRLVPASGNARKLLLTAKSIAEFIAILEVWPSQKNTTFNNPSEDQEHRAIDSHSNEYLVGAS